VTPEPKSATRKSATRVGRLHVLTDAALQQRWSHLEIACRAAAGGADVVQYREKRPLTTAELVRTARAIRHAVPADVRLVIDDRADVAVAAGAQGVHLGRYDLGPDVARRIVGADCWIGCTANSLDAARRLFAEPVDYLGVGPVFGTRSKSDPAPALGLEALAAIARDSPLPVIAIGGITPEHVALVLHAGAHGVAVLSGVALAADPERAAARYREALERALSELEEGSPPPEVRT
jgi:thiamine-phosphate pyrophosphorylase